MSVLTGKLPTSIAASWPKLRRAGDAVFLTTSIEIAAPARLVWTILCDFPSYRAWNPFLTAIVGKARHGAPLHITMAGVNEQPVTVRARICTIRRQRELAWAGQLLAPGLFDGVHRIRLEARDSAHTLVSQDDRFSGVFAELLGQGLIDSAQRGFETMNAALKARAETR